MVPAIATIESRVCCLRMQEAAWTEFWLSEKFLGPSGDHLRPRRLFRRTVALQQLQCYSATLQFLTGSDFCLISAPCKAAMSRKCTLRVFAETFLSGCLIGGVTLRV